MTDKKDETVGVKGSGFSFDLSLVCSSWGFKEKLKRGHWGKKTKHGFGGEKNKQQKLSEELMVCKSADSRSNFAGLGLEVSSWPDRPQTV